MAKTSKNSLPSSHPTSAFTNGGGVRELIDQTGTKKDLMIIMRTVQSERSQYLGAREELLTPAGSDGI